MQSDQAEQQMRWAALVLKPTINRLPLKSFLLTFLPPCSSSQWLYYLQHFVAFFCILTASLQGFIILTFQAFIHPVVFISGSVLLQTLYDSCLFLMLLYRPFSEAFFNPGFLSSCSSQHLQYPFLLWAFFFIFVLGLCIRPLTLLLLFVVAIFFLVLVELLCLLWFLFLFECFPPSSIRLLVLSASAPFSTSEGGLFLGLCSLK